MVFPLLIGAQGGCDRRYDRFWRRRPADIGVAYCLWNLFCRTPGTAAFVASHKFISMVSL